MTKTKGAIVYVRLSSYRGKKDPTTSPERQKEVCEAYCAARGWTVVQIIEDLDVSGSDKGPGLERPGLKKIRAAWGSFDVIIFAKLDRFARSLLDFMLFEKEAKAHDATLVSVGENLDLTTPQGRAFAQTLTSFAELEAATISSRVLDSMAALRTMGRYGGGNRTFGYQSVPNPNGNGRVLILEPGETAIVRDAARRVLEGEKLSKITNSLNDDGVKTRRGNRWSMRVLGGLLTSDAVMGRLIHKGVALMDEETGLPLEVWPPILDSDTVSRLKVKLNPDKPAGVIRNRSAKARLLSGLVRCDDCAKPMYQRVKHGRNIYECSSRSNGLDCTGCSVSADRLEEFVSAQFLNRYSSLEVMELTESGADEIEAAEVERSITATTSELGKVGADRVSLLERLDILLDRRTEIGRTPHKTVLVGTGVLYGDAWKNVEARRSILAANIKSLTIRKGTPGKTGPIDPNRVDLEWVEPLFRPILERSSVAEYPQDRVTFDFGDTISFGELEPSAIEEGTIASADLLDYEEFPK